MKIAILTHRELASAVAVSLVANRLRDHDLRIFVSAEQGAFSEGAPSIGALEHVEQALEKTLDDSLADTPADRPGLRSLGRLALDRGQPLQPLVQPNSAAGLQRLHDAKPDLLLSIRYRRILHADAIAVPPLGVINWHSGLLPEYQGVMATFWAMRRGDAQIGSTLHYIADKTIDTGPILARFPIDCRYDLTYLDNVLRLYVAGADGVVDTVRQIVATGTAPHQPQQGTAAYYSAPGEDDVREFLASGHTLYDGDELGRLIGTL